MYTSYTQSERRSPVTALWWVATFVGGGLAGALGQIVWSLADRRRDAVDLAELTEDVIAYDIRVAHALHLAQTLGQTDIATILESE